MTTQNILSSGLMKSGNILKEVLSAALSRRKRGNLKMITTLSASQSLSSALSFPYVNSWKRTRQWQAGHFHTTVIQLSWFLSQISSITNLRKKEVQFRNTSKMKGKLMVLRKQGSSWLQTSRIRRESKYCPEFYIVLNDRFIVTYRVSHGAGCLVADLFKSLDSLEVFFLLIM